MVFANATRVVEEAVARALPDAVRTVIEAARNGDVKAATYLLDRHLGRVAQAFVAPAEDMRLETNGEALPSSYLDLKALDFHTVMRIRQLVADALEPTQNPALVTAEPLESEPEGAIDVNVTKEDPMGGG